MQLSAPVVNQGHRAVDYILHRHRVQYFHGASTARQSDALGPTSQLGLGEPPQFREFLASTHDLFAWTHRGEM
jgi:hypothetical protein